MHDAVAEALDSFLQEHCSPEQIRKYERGKSTVGLWRGLTELGFADALLPEAVGGAALAFADIRGLTILLGRYLLPVPLAETMIARALLHEAGAAFPPGPIVLATPARAPDGWAQSAVPSALTAEFALAEVGDQLILLKLGSTDVWGTGVHGSLAADLHWPQDSEPLTAIPASAVALRTLCAASRAAQMLGAMERILELTLAYAHSREQFGRPIATFQAIQQQLAVMAENVLAASMAVQVAFSEHGIAPQRLCVAVAKQRASEAAARTAALAHAIHGAIGLCEEYDLQLYVRRLCEWRLSDGSEAYWSHLLGAERLAVAGNSVDFIRRHLWPRPSRSM